MLRSLVGSSVHDGSLMLYLITAEIDYKSFAREMWVEASISVNLLGGWGPII